VLPDACNPSYSGGRDQEDRASKPAQANSSQDPISKKAITKRAGGVEQGVGSEFKPKNCQKKKRQCKSIFKVLKERKRSIQNSLSRKNILQE
jgi:hypothetical protein